MMGKDVESYVARAIKSLQEEENCEWELIFVDDSSADETFSIVSDLAVGDSRIKPYRNQFAGKVLGTSYAYSLSRGSIVKCIDSDDVLLPEFFEFMKLHDKHDVLFHSAHIVDSELKQIAEYHPSSEWMKSDFRGVAEGLISFPKWTWSFRREIADKIFPLPEDLPFEDVWMSLMCKKHARQPWFTREPLYLYRQHGNQTFGGILNFSRQATVFRANRLLKLLDALEGERRLHAGSAGIQFSRARKESLFLAGRAGISTTVFDPFSWARLGRLLFSGRAPLLLKYAAIHRWRREGKFK